MAGHSQDAIDHFEIALKHDPSSGLDIYEDCLANAYLELEMIPEAIAECKRILQAGLRYPPASYHLGVAYEKANDRTDAMIAFHRYPETKHQSRFGEPRTQGCPQAFAIGSPEFGSRNQQIVALSCRRRNLQQAVVRTYNIEAQQVEQRWSGLSFGIDALPMERVHTNIRRSGSLWSLSLEALS